MKIIVAAKRVIDPYVRVRVADDSSGVITKNAKMAMNPFDEIALEEAVRLKEQGIATEVVILSIGETVVQETLRKGLAIGADRAIHIDTAESLEPLNVAKILQQIALKETPDLIILGKQAIDGDNNQTGQMLAALLDWPQGTFISELKIESGKAHITREVDGGLEYLTLTLPAVVTTDLRLNEPRYASLPSIMKAKSKLLTTIPLAELELDLKSKTKVTKVSPPKERQRGIKVPDSKTLIQQLKHEAQVI